jgi:hypothetical protein
MTIPVLTGLATMNDDVLVDSLVADVIDGLREDLHPQFGVRAYRMFVVTRTWNGSQAGDGAFVDAAAELRPQPRLWQWTGLKYVQANCGIREVGDVKATEVSLTYTAEQIDPRSLTKRQEFFIGLADANGQMSPTRLWTHVTPPFIDREKDMGWVFNLRRVETAPPWVPS